MREKADTKAIGPSQKFNKLYDEIRNWNDGDDIHERGSFEEQQKKQHLPFTVPYEEIGVKYINLLWQRKPVDVFLNMNGLPSGLSNHAIQRIVLSTNDYISEHWAEKSGKPPNRKVSGRPEGARVLPPADHDDGYVREAELLSFLGLNFLMGYHRLSELEHYWEMKSDTGVRLGLFQQSMTRGRFKFIS